MANGIRTGDPHEFNKGRSSKFRVGSRVQQTAEEDRRTDRPKCCRNSNKDEDSSLKTLNDKNHQASSKKNQTTITISYNAFGYTQKEQRNTEYSVGIKQVN